LPSGALVVALASLAIEAGCGKDSIGGDGGGILFRDVTAEAFPSTPISGTPYGGLGLGGGAAIGDLDGDGDLDVVLAIVQDTGATTRSRVYVNETSLSGAIRFREGDILGDGDAIGVTLFDLENDGDLDIFLARRGVNRLYRNDGSMTFTDVARSAGLVEEDTSTGCVAFDANKDGLVDLYVTNFTPTAEGATVPAEDAANRLYLNKGDGTFAEVGVLSGTASMAASHTAAVADLFGDESVELYVANDSFSINGHGGVGTHDALYRLASIDANGVPRFEDVAPGLGVDRPRSSMGIAFRDFDGDQRLDVYVTDWGSNALYVWDDGSQQYVDKADIFGVQAGGGSGFDALIGWGAAALDLDSDGAVELVVINGDVNAPPSAGEAASPFYPYQLDEVLWQPRAGAPFVSITETVGWPIEFDDVPEGSTINGRGVVVGDLDGDGDDDLVVSGYGEPTRVFATEIANPGHSVRLRLVGTQSGSVPAGARVLLRTSGGRDLRQQYVVGGTPFGSSDPCLRFGLGNELAEEIEIRWPSGMVQLIELVDMDREMTVVEPQ